MRSKKVLQVKKIIDIDKPDTTVKRSKIIEKKLFLKNTYIDFYEKINTLISPKNKKGFLVELGSGGGFIKKVIPNMVTSDILELPKIDMQFSALDMPFKSNSVNAFVMIDVLHHIDDIETFLNEINRCLKKDGQLIMIEPSHTMLGKVVYKYFHSEPYNPKGGWTFASTGPLSGANTALPWIVFIRDRKLFKQKYPYLKITAIQPHTPLKYLLSGGLTFPQVLPNSFYPLVTFTEGLLNPLKNYVGIFYTIAITKVK
jgi:SAM-dependent methyltransferase